MVIKMDTAEKKRERETEKNGHNQNGIDKGKNLKSYMIKSRE